MYQKCNILLAKVLRSGASKNVEGNNLPIFGYLR